MDWEKLDWKPAPEALDQVAGALAPLASSLGAALEEAASELALSAMTLETPRVARVPAAEVAGALTPLASFELLGAARRCAWVATMPGSADRLGETPLEAGELGRRLAEAFDRALATLAGDGLGLGAADAAPTSPSGDLLLIRLDLRAEDGAPALFVVAVEEAVPAELVAHVVTFQALGDGPAGPAAGPAEASTGAQPGGDAESAPAPAAPAPAATDGPEGPATTARTGPAVGPMALEQLTPAPVSPGSANLELLMGVHLQVAVELGRTRIAIRDLLALAPGSIVELDKLAGEAADVLVNGRPIAHGEVVIVDENFGVRITGIISRQRRLVAGEQVA